MKAVKLIVVALATLVVLLVAAVLILIAWVNPNDYRGGISQLARDQAGVALRLEGDLAWTLFPVLGFRASDVGIGLQPGAPELASIAELAVGVEVLPLFQRRLAVDAVHVDGMSLALQVDAQGRGNWETDAAEQTSEAGAPAAASSSPTFAVDLASVQLTDAVIRYSDAAAGSDYRIDVARLQLSDVRFGEAFPLQLEADVAGLFPAALPLSLSGDITIGQSADTIRLAIKQLLLSTLRSSGWVEVNRGGDTRAFSGAINTSPVNLRQWLQSVGESAPPTRDKAAFSEARLELALQGDEQAIQLKPLVIQLDDSHISGELAVTDVSAQALAFTLALDRLDLDRYLAPDVETPSATPAPAGGGGDDDTVIPVESLRALNARGTLAIAELTVSDTAMTDAEVTVAAGDGQVQLALTRARVLGGSGQGEVRIDARTSEPDIKAQLALDSIAIGELLKPWLPAQVLTGVTSTRVDLTTQGNTTEALLRAALGQLDLQLQDAVLHGININDLAVAQVREKLGGFELLFPDYQQKLPSSLKRDTDIRPLLTQWRIENGHLILPAVNADTSEGELGISGDIDLLGQGFDFRLKVQPQALADNKYLAGSSWPIRCQGGWDAPVTSWCRVDAAAVETTLQKAAQRAAKDKAAGKLAKELGVEGDDAETVEAEARERAKAEEDRLKRKAREAINKELNKLFD